MYQEVRVLSLIREMSMKPVVFAGGTGSRLWPKSRAALPKQFLSLTSDNTMLQDTIVRLNGTKAQSPFLYVMMHTDF